MTRRIHTGEMEDLIRWFLAHMPAEQRVKLMAERPATYKMLYPDVKDESILFQVQNHLQFLAEESRNIVPKFSVNL